MYENGERVEGQEFYGRGELKYHGGNRGKEDLGESFFSVFLVARRRL